jgi:hypothetical protein
MLSGTSKAVLSRNWVAGDNINSTSATTQVYIQFTGPQAGYPYSGRVQPKTGSTPFSDYFTPSYLLF